VTLVVTEAALALSRPSGPPGTAVTVTGAGFPAGDTVTLTFKDKSGKTTALGATTADGSGSFSKGVQVPQNARRGKGRFTAKSGVTGVAPKKAFTVT
jgi:hypothetical protein